MRDVNGNDQPRIEPLHFAASVVICAAVPPVLSIAMTGFKRGRKVDLMLAVA